MMLLPPRPIWESCIYVGLQPPLHGHVPVAHGAPEVRRALTMVPVYVLYCGIIVLDGFMGQTVEESRKEI